MTLALGFLLVVGLDGGAALLVLVAGPALLVHVVAEVLTVTH